jgi:hypothetical protein
MSATRSGTIYNSTTKSVRPVFFEPSPRPMFANNLQPGTDRCIRKNRTQFSTETLHELCTDSDNDSTSTYDHEDVEAEEEQYMQPKYDVNIDFDEASEAWRANKRRVGEGWVYIVKQPPKKTMRHKTRKINQITEPNNIASRVKELLNRRRAAMKGK